SPAPSSRSPTSAASRTQRPHERTTAPEIPERTSVTTTTTTTEHPLTAPPLPDRSPHPLTAAHTKETSMPTDDLPGGPRPRITVIRTAYPAAPPRAHHRPRAPRQHIRDHHDHHHRPPPDRSPAPRPQPAPPPRCTHEGDLHAHRRPPRRPPAPDHRDRHRLPRRDPRGLHG